MAAVNTPTAGTVAQVQNNAGYIDPTQTAQATSASGTSSNVTGAPSAIKASTIGSANNAALTTANQNDKGTVQGQLDNIIAANSPIMQRAAAKADTQSNARGILNSSMAVGAAQGAVMDAAMPIAQADAASTNQYALTNAAAANQNAQFNAGQDQQVKLADQNAINSTNQFNNSGAQQVALTDAQAKNAMGILNVNNAQDASKYNAGQVNAAITANAGFKQANDVQNVVEQNKMATVAQDAINKANIADRASTAQIASAANTSGASVISTMNAEIAAIQNSAMSAADKTAAIATAQTRYGNALNVIAKMGGIEVTNSAGRPITMSSLLVPA